MSRLNKLINIQKILNQILNTEQVLITNIDENGEYDFQKVCTISKENILSILKDLDDVINDSKDSNDLEEIKDLIRKQKDPFKEIRPTVVPKPYNPWDTHPWPPVEPWKHPNQIWCTSKIIDNPSFKVEFNKIYGVVENDKTER